MNTYRIIEDGKAIQCFVCNHVSHSANDIVQLYCSHCNIFHEDVAKELSDANQTIDITVDAVTALCIIGNIQLATRHPNNIGASRKIAEEFARQLQLRVAGMHPNTAAMIDKGWDPEFDN